VLRAVSVRYVWGGCTGTLSATDGTAGMYGGGRVDMYSYGKLAL
jgi:hypothetical protein